MDIFALINSLPPEAAAPGLVIVFVVFFVGLVTTKGAYKNNNTPRKWG